MLSRSKWIGIPLGLIALTASSLAFAQGTLTHDYELNGSYSDALGGPSLVNDGGTLSSTQYSFNANQGLNLSNAINASNYSIETRFSFSSLSGYRKILDFKNLLSDNGLYNLNSSLNFYPVATSSSSDFATDVFADLVVTRDGSNGLFTGYVNGNQVLSFTDSSSLAVFSEPNNIIRFFEDDTATGQREASAGSVDRIRIYEGALTAAQVRDLDNNPAVTPEGNSLLLICSGLIPFVGFNLWRRRQKCKV